MDLSMETGTVPTDLSMEIDEDEDINKLENSVTPKAKRKRSKIDDDVGVASSRKRNIKGIILSVTKPSYTLKSDLGPDIRSLRCEHRNRLRYLLRKLIRRQNWDEASGVLSVLLKGTHKESSISTNRTKYWATLELIEHMGSAKTKTKKIQQVYNNIWMKKNFAITKTRRHLKGRFDVQLEYLIFCLSQGDTDEANTAVISFLQDTDFPSDPIENLVVGLTFSHLWYTSIQKELQSNDSLESPTPIQSGTSGIDHSSSNEQCVVEVQDSHSHSNTSIRIDKIVNEDRGVQMEVDDNVKKEVQYEEQLHSNSVESDQTGNSLQFPFTGNKQFGSVFYIRDVENFLMPIRFPNTSTNKLEGFISFQRKIQTDHYKAAVKHLRNALHSTPPAFEALLPLIQMLLFGDKVKEAIEEVESVVQNSHASLHFRVKASLQEHFSNGDVTKLCMCFEDTLKKDPTCSHSLSKLISFHHDGFYSIKNLVEMIGMHLDATYAECHIWREFASCFIRLSQCEEDRMSSCGGEDRDSSKKHSKNTPDMFKDNVIRKKWRLRCRWWLTRHFTQTILASEVASGNVELIAYKAACACHLYGSKFAYVVKACEYLKKEKSREMSVLKMHMDNAIGICVA